MRHLVYSERFVGIDVGPAHFEMDVYPQPNALRFDNTQAGHDSAAEELLKHAPRLIVVGASGGDAAHLVAALEARRLCVAVINPCKARKFAEAIGLLARKERVDAHMLARYAHAVRPENLRNQACIIFEELLLKKIYLAWPA